MNRMRSHKPRPHRRTDSRYGGRLKGSNARKGLTDKDCKAKMPAKNWYGVVNNGTQTASYSPQRKTAQK